MLCACGCGLVTPIAKQTRSDRGIVKGEHTRFVPSHGSRTNRPLAERFWPKVRKADGDSCWEFIGGKDSEGYGVIRDDDGRVLGAHQASWKLAHGAIPSGAHVLHTCDNRPCVRPDHLFLGDQAINTADMVAKGRQRGAPGERHAHAKLSETDVRQIRAAYDQRAPRDGSVRRSREALSARFGVSVTHVIAIQTGRAWTHLLELAS